MNDPHVDSLKYTVCPSRHLQYEDAPPVRFDTPEFSGLLQDDVVTLKLKRHCSSPAEARALVDDWIRGWEIRAGVTTGDCEFNLAYAGAHIVDRSPTPGIESAYLEDAACVSDAAGPAVTRGRYPVPPTDFTVTPEADVIWERYCRYLRGEEPLLSMAYFSLTLLERKNRRAAANHFQIDYAVLRKLGELTSTRGDGLTARKHTEETTPLQREEKLWIQACIKAIVKHIGSGGDRGRLTMDLLPPL